MFLISDTQDHSKVKAGSINIDIGQGTHLKEWPVQGGRTDHALPPLILNTALKQAWKTNIGAGVNEQKKLTSNLIVAANKIFAMDSRGKVSALNKVDGHPIWTISTSPDDREDDTLGGGIAYENGVIFVTTSFGEVIALNAADGKQLWKQTSVMTPMRVAPTVKDGRVFVLTIGNELAALNAKSGEVLWNHTGLPESTSLLGGATPAIADNLIVIPYSSGEVYALRVENGYPVWTDSLSPSQSFDSLSSIAHIRARPVISNGTVYIVSHGGRMVAIELNTGIRIWQKEIGGIRTPAIFGNYLFVLTTTQEMLCLDRTSGETLWSNNLPQLDNTTPIYWAGPVLAGGSLVVTGSNGEIRFLSPRDGKLKHQLNLSEGLPLSPVIVDGTLYSQSNNGSIHAWR